YREGKQKFYSELEQAMTKQDTVYQWRRQYVRENKSGVVPTLTANMGTGGHNVPLILTDKGDIRKLTPKETFNVQGYPKTFKVPDNVSNGQLYKQAGNSVVVPVIKRIATNVAKALNGSTTTKAEQSSGKVAIIYTKINGQFEGASYVKEFVDSYEHALKKIESYQDNLPILTDEEYLKIIKRRSEREFYSIV
ncbi:DNA cytosine methyltransferase, partial [Streptococcus lutetiensis]